LEFGQIFIILPDSILISKKKLKTNKPYIVQLINYCTTQVIVQSIRFEK
jgi:hypothetical protein